VVDVKAAANTAAPTNKEILSIEFMNNSKGIYVCWEQRIARA
jgi:hypothetical protein